ncbi:D-Ala-D-Ala carboxypeptidase family metallohydrolase [Acinetobacter haemolyticus]|uniref:D-Ala-D-Ala carboxypeptidase family metallohydrolase n=1 Tax=Acinetobacter haemolyticus TaxID=29430 RepID=UPI000F740BED|nr:D-Ala-D-Ala carboxypeptidase family metallohydrolase [Acinetobacter haemolyticus]RSN77913.1 peptidase M15 [Acinetobacter haemolyticus]
MQVTKNFTLAELLHSNTAVRKGIKNVPTTDHQANLITACHELFQPIRDALGKSVLISSGYRSIAVNNAVGGSKSSAHCVGFAIDFISPSFGTPADVAKFLATELPKRGIKFDQIILEFDSWVHIGYKNQAGEQRGQVLTAKKVRGVTRFFNGVV